MEGIKTLAEVEKEHILSTLKKLRGDKLNAATALDIGKTTLYRKLKAWNITDDFGYK